MKAILIIVGLLSVFSCTNGNKSLHYQIFEEQKLSFISLQCGVDTTTGWIRKPENLLMVHETLKKADYKKIVQNLNRVHCRNPELYIQKDIYELMDGLILGYQFPEKSPKYYREFWIRRKVEKNEKEVFHILNEIKEILVLGKKATYDKMIVNDTLEQLIRFEYQDYPITDEKFRQQKDYLIKMGLHQSAFNLINNESYRFSKREWKKVVKLASFK